MTERVEPADVLMQPLAINSLTLANRIIMGPMAVLATRPDGHPSEQTIAFFRERARGGVGMIIVGGSVATSRAVKEAPFGGLLRMDDDRFVPELKRMTDLIHEDRVPIIAELMTSFGPMAKPSGDWPAIAASPHAIVTAEDQFPVGIIVPGGRAGATPQEATIDEIRQLGQETVDAALRCQRAGFDGVEIAAHMSYFVASFLSPRTNRRTDEYGGDAENRARVIVDQVRHIREAAGASFVIGLRLSANEHCDGGQGPEGFAEIARIAERAGLDYVAMTDGNYVSMRRSAPDTDGDSIEHGEAQAFRATLSGPLIIGSIHDPHRAAQAIADGHADAVMFARQMLADPRYPAKVRDGRLTEIVQCDRQNLCMRRMIMGMPVRCSVNARMGRESRAPGQRPPVARVLRAPLEGAILGGDRFVASDGRRRKVHEELALIARR